MDTLLPPPMPPSFQMMRDAEHLKLLGIFHYVIGGFSILGMAFGALYALIGFGLVFGGPTSGFPTPPGMPFNPAWFFAGVGIVIGSLSLVSGLGHFFAARYMAQRRNRTFCLVVAGISCLSIPIGTVLGVFCILVLSRPSVVALFDRQPGLPGPSF